MIWVCVYAALGVLTSLIVPLLLTEKHETEVRKLGGSNVRVALCVIAGVAWPVLLVEYVVRGVLLVSRALKRLTWLGALNFIVLQWFGVRLAKCYENRQRFVRATHLSHLPDGSISLGYQCDHERVFVGYRLLRWIVPLTGWWSDFRWIGARPK